MKNIALIFPGQGSQYPGMGKDLYDNFPRAKQMLDRANDALGFDLLKIIFEGPEDLLRQTQYTQPAIFAVSAAAFSVFEESYPLDTVSVCTAGHSLGEYSALFASGVFGFSDGLKLVKKRGEYIQQASERNPGTMAALIGLEPGTVRDLCAKAGSEGACEPVNFNSPGQIVIAGTEAAVKKAVELAPSAGAAKAVMLSVSGPFHSSLMGPASEMMKAELAPYAFNAPRFKFISNCDAASASEPGMIKANLVRQINSAVLWDTSVKAMADAGCEIFIEIGPQRVLSGLMRRIDKTKKTFNIEDLKSLTKTLEELRK